MSKIKKLYTSNAEEEESWSRNGRKQYVIRSRIISKNKFHTKWQNKRKRASEREREKERGGGGTGER